VSSDTRYGWLLKKQRERRGECVECGKAKCSCKKASLHGCPKCGKEFDFNDHYCGPVKKADVDPNIRSSVDDSKPNGLDVQQPLLRNPYSTGTAGNPQAAMQFENGYQFAQSMGHQQLNQVQPQQAQSWLARPKPWRDGFAQAARGMGCGNVASQLDAANKIAQRNTTMALDFPIGVNLKIASALGTVAGGLAGAGLGGMAGEAIGEHQPLDGSHLHFATDHLHNPHNDENFTGNPTADSLINSGITHATDAGHAIGDRINEDLNQPTMADLGRDVGGATGAVGGAMIGDRIGNRMPYPSMGLPKLATAYFESLRR